MTAAIARTRDSASFAVFRNATPEIPHTRLFYLRRREKGRSRARQMRPQVKPRNLQFSVGGYVSPNGAEIQTTSNLASAWQTVSALSVGTNAMKFATPVSAEGPPAYFKVRTTQP